jgi:glycosyltransferase involved in cell wall biosynthesis
MSRVNKLVTFHDMTFFLMPKVHLFFKRKLFRFYIWLSSKVAVGIFAISKCTKSDINRILKVNSENIFVTPLGIDEVFKESQKNNDHNVLKKYNINYKYILYVGTIEPRKNILGLIKAYNELPKEIKSNYKMIVCGKKGWMCDVVYKYVSENELKENVIFLDYVTDIDLNVLYKNASIFAYVSFYEGFGIPLLEAMACGLPCITSNIGSMKEIAEDACVNIDPNNVEQIKNAIINIINDSKLRSDLKNKAIKRSKEYSWLKCASLTLEAYEKVNNAISKAKRYCKSV